MTLQSALVKLNVYELVSSGALANLFTFGFFGIIIHHIISKLGAVFAGKKKK